MKSTDSAYHPVFRSMFRNVVAALDEALDITLFLKCLANHFEVSLILIHSPGQFEATTFLLLQELENSEFPDIVPQLRPLMHSVCLVYSHSTFYNSPARIIVLMTETCNLLIGMGRKFLDPTSLFQAS